MTFIHQFSRRLRVTIQVADQPPADGKLQIDAQWSELPSRKCVRPYVRWVCEVSRVLATKWNLKLAYVVQVAPRRWELWTFDPGQAPRLAEVLKQ